VRCGDRPYKFFSGFAHGTAMFFMPVAALLNLKTTFFPSSFLKKGPSSLPPPEGGARDLGLETSSGPAMITFRDRCSGDRFPHGMAFNPPVAAFAKDPFSSLRLYAKEPLISNSRACSNALGSPRFAAFLPHSHLSDTREGFPPPF